MKAAHDPTSAPAAWSSPTDDDEWPDLVIPVEPTRPRIPPAEYQARSVKLENFKAFERRCLAIYFDVYQGTFERGVILARLPAYFRLPPDGGRLSPASKLLRMFDLLHHRRTRSNRLPMNLLRHRLWLVDVGDATTGAPHERQRHPTRLHDRQVYSVVRSVKEHLA